MHVLFVDDNFDTTKLFRLGFTLEGHTVDTACNGPEALRIIEQKASALDVLVMENRMPAMSGIEVARELRLRQKGDLAPLPIILFTTDAKVKLEGEVREAGVSRVVYKPILPNELFAVIEEVVNAT